VLVLNYENELGCEEFVIFSYQKQVCIVCKGEGFLSGVHIFEQLCPVCNGNNVVNIIDEHTISNEWNYYDQLCSELEWIDAIINSDFIEESIYF